MDSWSEERQEVLESVLEALPQTLEDGEAAACSFLLQHLLRTAPEWQAINGRVPAESRRQLGLLSRGSPSHAGRGCRNRSAALS